MLADPERWAPLSRPGARHRHLRADVAAAAHAGVRGLARPAARPVGQRIDVSGRVSTIVHGTALSNSVRLAARRTGDNERRRDAAAEPPDVRRRPERAVRLHAAARDARLDIDLAQRRPLASATPTGVIAGLQRTIASPLTAGFVGLTKNLGSFGLGVERQLFEQARDRHRLAAVLRARPRAAHRRLERRCASARRHRRGLGARFRRPNMNGVRDPGEELVPNAGFILNGGGRYPSRTDADGTAFIGRLAPGQYADIALDPSTLEDPQWKPTDAGRAGAAAARASSTCSSSRSSPRRRSTAPSSCSARQRRRGIGDAHIELVDRRRARWSPRHRELGRRLLPAAPGAARPLFAAHRPRPEPRSSRLDRRARPQHRRAPPSTATSSTARISS